MPTEGPMDSPAQGEPTTKSAVEPLPPGSDAEEVVDEMERRARKAAETDVAEDGKVATDDADGGHDTTDAPD